MVKGDGMSSANGIGGGGGSEVVNGEGNEKKHGACGAGVCAPEVRQDTLSYADVKIVEANAAATFSLNTFVKQLVYHFFYPVSVPLIAALEGGSVGLMNHMFLPRRHNRAVVVFTVQLIVSTAFWLLNTLSFYFMVQRNNYSFVYDVLLVDIMWLLRNAVIASKYAFVHPAEMKEMKDQLLGPNSHTGRMLFTSWRDPIPTFVLRRELLLAAARQKLVLRHTNFHLEGSTTSAEALLDMVADLELEGGGERENENQEEALGMYISDLATTWLRESATAVIRDPDVNTEEGGRISPSSLPVRIYVAHVITQASRITRLRRIGDAILADYTALCALCFAVIHAALPIIVRSALGGHPYPGPFWARRVIEVSMVIVIVFSMYSNYGFMIVGVLDFRRRQFIAHELNELLRNDKYEETRERPSKERSSSRLGSFLLRRSPSDVAVSLQQQRSSAFSGVHVDFTDPESLMAWWASRQLTQDFGRTFYQRIQNYSTFYAIYCGLLLGFVALRLLYGVERNDIYLIIMVVYSVDIFLFLLALMVWPGGDTNMLGIKHGATLISKKMALEIRMREERDTLAPAEMERLRCSVEAINHIAEAVRWDNGKMQLSVVGFQAGEQLVAFIVAVVSSTILLGIEQIVQNYYSN